MPKKLQVVLVSRQLKRARGSCVLQRGRLPFDGLRMLVPGTGIHHTSMGSQYANSKYRLALKDYGLIGSMVTPRNRHEQLYANRFFTDVLADRMLLNWIPFQRKEAMSPGVLIHRTTVVNGPHRTPAAAAEGRVCDQSLKVSRNYRQAIKQFLDQQ